MLVLPEELTHASAAASAHMLGLALRAHPPAGTVVVDAQPLRRFDTSALAVLLECRRGALVSGRGFAVRALPARLRSLAELHGVAELLPAAQDPPGRDQALAD